MLEVDAMNGLLLQFGVAEALTLLENQELHYGDIIGVGVTAFFGVVAVHGLNDRSEGFPVMAWSILARRSPSLTAFS